MNTRKLGPLNVSVVGLGCNNFGMVCDDKQTAEVVNTALDEGVNFFDTADVYGNGLSEKFLGKALAGRRDEVLVATKFGNPMRDEEGNVIADTGGGSRRWIKQAVEDSLSRLGTDRIDLYQMHLPAGDVPLEETVEALTELQREGKVMQIGCSNFSGELIDDSIKTSKDLGLGRWISAQNHYNLLVRGLENDVIPACERNELGMLPYFPLASGFLTGKYRRGETPSEGTRFSRVPPERSSFYLNDQNYEILEKLEAFAAERGYSVLNLAISWLAAQPTVASVISGATKPEQVRANVAAVRWQMTDEDLKEIDSITRR